MMVVVCRLAGIEGIKLLASLPTGCWPKLSSILVPSMSDVAAVELGNRLDTPAKRADRGLISSHRSVFRGVTQCPGKRANCLRLCSLRVYPTCCFQRDRSQPLAQRVVWTCDNPYQAKQRTGSRVNLLYPSPASCRPSFPTPSASHRSADRIDELESGKVLFVVCHHHALVRAGDSGYDHVEPATWLAGRFPFRH